jgi:hypothetical protein
MKKLVCIASLLGSSVLPMVPPAAAQVVVHKPGHTMVFQNRRAARRFFRRGRWYSNRAWRKGHWVYW